jgi:hypothetical protein
MNSASKVRDRFSVDGWMALNDLATIAPASIASPRRLATTAPAQWACCCARSPAFPALCMRTCTASLGWRFLTIGRSLERAMAMASLLARLTDQEAPDGALDFVVEVGDSTLSHRSRYTVRTTRPSVIDLLALDDDEPAIDPVSARRAAQAGRPFAGRHGAWRDVRPVRAVLRVQTDVACGRRTSSAPTTCKTSFNGMAGLSELLTDAI